MINFPLSDHCAMCNLFVVTGTCAAGKRRRRSLILENPIDGATYDFEKGLISPTSSPKTKYKREANRNDKSLSMSKLEELNQVMKNMSIRTYSK